MKLTIVMNDNAHVHAAGCADIARRERRARQYLSDWDTDAATRQEAANDAWSDFIGESMTEADALAYTEFYPCCSALPEGDPS
jgi:hypothetical protein